MTVSRQPQITEELLSAYLDDQVTAEERALVEAAIATDPAIAWQVDSLRQTVHLLQALPPLALPRTFAIEAILAEAHATDSPTPVQPEVVAPTSHVPRRPAVRRPVVEEPETPWWHWFLQLWQGGNLQLRNAAAVALTLFFVFFAGDRFLVPTQPIAVMTPAAAPVAPTSEPVVVTSAERIVVEPPVAPAAAEPTATSAPATVMATAVVDSNNQAAEAATGNEATANLLASPAPQTEASARQPEGATFGPPGGAPGPVQQDMTGASEPNTDVPNVDAMAAQNIRTAESNERGMMTKATAPVSDAVTADTAETLQYSITATSPSTIAALAAPMSATITHTGAITLTLTVTPVMTLTQAVTPTATMVSVAPLTTATPTGDEGGAWLTWLTWAQMITALSTVVFAGLWWRSRR